MSDRVVNLQHKARILSQIRAFFSHRGVLEADVPCLDSHGVTDPFLTNFECDWQGQTRYLQTSPEFALKRLLSEGFGDCYYLGKAFRNEARSTQHSPEFMILEWYRIGMTPEQLMNEIAELITCVLGIDKTDSMSYADAFMKYANIDIWQATREQLIKIFPGECHFDLTLETDSDLLQMLFSILVEPQIGQEFPCFIYDFPLDQAALAQANEDGLTAQRFELYYKGFELANGYGELTDPEEQARRFGQDNNRRLRLGKKLIEPDVRLVEALKTGLPNCSGVALGVDRLCMLALGLEDINLIQFN